MKKQSFSAIFFGLVFMCLFSICTVKAKASDTITIPVSGQYNQTEARSMLDMINKFRTGSEAWYWNEDDTTKTLLSDLDKFTYDYELEKVAMKRAAELAVSFSHTRPNGQSCFTAYDMWYSSKGENIAYGQSSASSVFVAWREDDYMYSGQGHRRNMLSGRFNRIGIGCFVYQGVKYWAQEFAYASYDTGYVEPNDSKTTVDVEALPQYAKAVSVKEGAQSGGFTFDVMSDNTAKITGCSLSGDITIPDKLDGYPVTVLEKQLFYNRDDVTSVYIPSTVTAFDPFDYVFSYCSSLKNITVSSDNQELCDVDGVLYSKDMTVLYCYPIGRKDKTYIVPESVKTICCTAFGNAPLKSIYISGMYTDWYAYTFFNFPDPYATTIYYKSGSKAESNVKSDLKTDYGTFALWDGSTPTVEKETDDKESADKETTDKESTSIPVNGVKLSKKKASIVKGKKMTLKATVTPSNATNKSVTWTSSNTKVATVNSKGVVTAKKPGTTNITATTVDGKKTATCKVTVTISVKKVTLNKTTASLKRGKKLTLKATINPKNASNKNVTWKSSNKKVATVDKNGVVKGLKKGTTTITVTTKDGKKTATCKVRVK